MSDCTSYRLRHLLDREQELVQPVTLVVQVISVTLVYAAIGLGVVLFDELVKELWTLFFP